MGAAAKPGTPATGGKGAAQPSRPTLAPAQGASMPAQGGKAQPTNTLPAPGQAATVPPQGGKAQNPDGTYTGSLGIPPQGGKSQADIDKFNADMAARQTGLPQKAGAPSQLGNLGLLNALYGNGGGQQPTTTTPSNIPGYAQPQVPAQGGKSSGQAGTPEQLAALQAQLDATRPMPQVLPQQNPIRPYNEWIQGQNNPIDPKTGANTLLTQDFERMYRDYAGLPANAQFEGQTPIGGFGAPMQQPAPSNVPSYAQPLVQKLAPAAKPGIAGIAQRIAAAKPKGRR